MDSENTIMELSHSQFKQATLRADRVDKEQLKKLLFGYFEEQEYYTVQELHKKTDQPSVKNCPFRHFQLVY